MTSDTVNATARAIYDNGLKALQLTTDQVTARATGDLTGIGVSAVLGLLSGFKTEGAGTEAAKLVAQTKAEGSAVGMVSATSKLALDLRAADKQFTTQKAELRDELAKLPGAKVVEQDGRWAVRMPNGETFHEPHGVVDMGSSHGTIQGKRDYTSDFSGPNYTDHNGANRTTDGRQPRQESRDPRPVENRSINTIVSRYPRPEARTQDDGKHPGPTPASDRPATTNGQATPTDANYSRSDGAEVKAGREEKSAGKAANEAQRRPGEGNANCSTGDKPAAPKNETPHRITDTDH